MTEYNNRSRYSIKNGPINTRLREAIMDFEPWGNDAAASYALDAAGAIYRTTLSAATIALLQHYRREAEAAIDYAAPAATGASVVEQVLARATAAQIALRQCVAIALLTDLRIDPAQVAPIDYPKLIDLALLKIS